jgi:hypothetical protein
VAKRCCSGSRGGLTGYKITFGSRRILQKTAAIIRRRRDCSTSHGGHGSALQAGCGNCRRLQITRMLRTFSSTVTDTGLKSTFRYHSHFRMTTWCVARYRSPCVFAWSYCNRKSHIYCVVRRTSILWTCCEIYRERRDRHSVRSSITLFERLYRWCATPPPNGLYQERSYAEPIRDASTVIHSRPIKSS